MLESKQPDLSILKDKWAVAELEVSYKPKQRTNFKIKSDDDADTVFRRMWDKELFNIQEQFCALFTSQSGEVIGFRVISTGTLNASIVDIPLLLSCALLCRSNAIFVAHNHPSGNHMPSVADKILTYKLKNACTAIGIKLIDHLILSDYDYYSFASFDKEFKSLES